ncbi:MAG: RNA 2',3'-cyclic phosphodiesterase [Clostridia bacterium]|nr:RNA 2',3'-cyclic phosphodiesterase [Clostridia bacterium]
MMRLFVGLEPAPAFRDALAEAQRRLLEAGVAGRYLTTDNLHLTLAFVGMWPEDITALLPPVEESFPLTLSHLGVFREAAVLWAGVEPSGALDRLAQRVRQRLDEAEIPYDRKAFYPHITLARKPVIPEGLTLEDIAIPRAAMEVREVCLYRSARGESGMRYTVIGRGGQEPGTAGGAETP